MTARVLDGRTVASHLWRDLSRRVAALVPPDGDPPRLAIVSLRDAGPQAVYAASLERAARSIGLAALVVRPAPDVTLHDLAGRLGALNLDPTVAGIVLAQPIPDHLALAEVVDLIDSAKDVDGATPTNAGRLARRLAPARGGCDGGDLSPPDAEPRPRDAACRHPGVGRRGARPDPLGDGESVDGDHRLRDQHHPHRAGGGRGLRGGSPRRARHQPGPRRRRAGDDDDGPAPDGRGCRAVRAAPALARLTVSAGRQPVWQ